jgi:hypothetical protein
VIVEDIFLIYGLKSTYELHKYIKSFIYALHIVCSTWRIKKLNTYMIQALAFTDAAWYKNVIAVKFKEGM